MQAIMDWYRPGAVILQCGADSLASDKLGSFNLSMQGAYSLFPPLPPYSQLTPSFYRSRKLCFVHENVQRPAHNTRRRRLHNPKRCENVGVRDWIGVWSGNVERNAVQ